MASCTASAVWCFPSSNSRAVPGLLQYCSAPMCVSFGPMVNLFTNSCMNCLNSRKVLTGTLPEPSTKNMMFSLEILHFGGGGVVGTETKMHFFTVVKNFPLSSVLMLKAGWAGQLKSCFDDPLNFYSICVLIRQYIGLYRDSFPAILVIWICEETEKCTHSRLDGFETVLY